MWRASRSHALVSDPLVWYQMRPVSDSSVRPGGVGWVKGKYRLRVSKIALSSQRPAWCLEANPMQKKPHGMSLYSRAVNNIVLTPWRV